MPSRYIILVIVNVSFFGISATASSSCNPRLIDDDPTKLICVCNSSSCDGLEFKWPKEQGQVYLVESSRSGTRFHVSDITKRSFARSLGSETEIQVNLDERNQPILGFGGTFTDAAALNINSLSPQLADNLIGSYYGLRGLQYNFGRVPLGSSDFSTRPYSYDDTEGPKDQIAEWSLAIEDVNHRIPLIKLAIDHAKKTKTVLKLFSTPWSAPAWMKTSGSLVGGQLIDEDEIYRAYTQYLMKFFDSYKSFGIKFWGTSVQNGPVSPKTGGYPINSMEYTDEQMIKFISNYLGPALGARGFTKKNFKLIIGEDNLATVDEHVLAVMSDPEVRKYVSGFAFHKHSTSGFNTSYDSITSIYDSLKDHIQFVMMSEACLGYMHSPNLGDWEGAELYAADVIEVLNRHTGIWIDLNLALNLEGGPSWSGYFTDSPIIVDAVLDEFYKQPAYYALAHFSRLFRPGSKIVGSYVDFSSENILTTAALNEKTGHLIINILNKGETSEAVRIKIEGSANMSQNESFESVVVASRSISSVVMKL